MDSSRIIIMIGKQATKSESEASAGWKIVSSTFKAAKILSTIMMHISLGE